MTTERNPLLNKQDKVVYGSETSSTTDKELEEALTRVENLYGKGNTVEEIEKWLVAYKNGAIPRIMLAEKIGEVLSLNMSANSLERRQFTELRNHDNTVDEFARILKMYKKGQIKREVLAGKIGEVLYPDQTKPNENKSSSAHANPVHANEVDEVDFRSRERNKEESYYLLRSYDYKQPFWQRWCPCCFS